MFLLALPVKSHGLVACMAAVTSLPFFQRSLIGLSTNGQVEVLQRASFPAVEQLHARVVQSGRWSSNCPAGMPHPRALDILHIDVHLKWQLDPHGVLLVSPVLVGHVVLKKHGAC